MKKAFIFLSFCILSIVVFLLVIEENYLYGNLSKYQKSPQKASNVEEDYKTTFIPSYSSKVTEPDLESLQCPIPIKDRVKNYTGIQCVYSSIEMLGRWAEEPKLIDPPITSRPDCKSYSSPKTAANRLEKLKVKYEQVWGDKKRGIELIKKAMNEGRGCLWDVPGHAMVLVHYSESENKVCWVDNADRSLRVQQTTINKFKERWGSWVLVIYADNDIVRYKMKNYLSFPIIDSNGKLINYPKDFIPYPSSNMLFNTKL
jgi:hypothetical protein